MGDDETVTLQSGDNEVFSVSKEVACQASLIKEMLEDTESEVAIPLPNVEGPILSKVIEYCTWHVGAEADGASEDAQNDYRAKFVEVDQGTLCLLIMAANYLNIAPLVDLACKAVADTMKGKTPEEIRAHFSIQSDLTPEEQAQVRRENAWCEEGGRAEAAGGSAAARGAGVFGEPTSLPIGALGKADAAPKGNPKVSNRLAPRTWRRPSCAIITGGRRQRGHAGLHVLAQGLASNAPREAAELSGRSGFQVRRRRAITRPERGREGLSPPLRAARGVEHRAAGAVGPRVERRSGTRTRSGSGHARGSRELALPLRRVVGGGGGGGGGVVAPIGGGVLLCA